MPDGICSVEGCTSSGTRRSLCNRHYLRVRRHGSTHPTRTCRAGDCSGELTGSQQLCELHRGQCVTGGCSAARAGRSSRCRQHKNYGGALLPATDGMKRCRRCLKELDRAAFYATSATRDGLQDRCKPCFVVYRAENRDKSASWRERNRARILAYNRAYEPRMRQLINARNASKTASAIPFTVEQLALRVAYYGGRCWICGAAYEHLDHVKPINAGGPHMLANLRPACARCNRRKNKIWPLTSQDLQRIRRP